MNKEQARKLLILVNNPQALVALEEYLQELTRKTVQDAVVAPSELEAFRALGKLALLETLQQLDKQVRTTLENFELSDRDEKVAQQEGWISDA